MTTATATSNGHVTNDHPDLVKMLAFQSEQLQKFAREIAHEVAQEEANKAINERQRTEDIRANRRNRNRFLTLLVALIMGFVTPTLCVFLGIAIAYSFVVILLPDALITLYALIRKY